MHSTIPEQHIAVGILRKPNGEVLVTSRPIDKLMAGYWEFPGGKIESGETLEHALRRELQEELVVTISQWRPLITLTHKYADKQVVLHVQLISIWTGYPDPQEGQSMAWETPAQLRNRQLLPADWPIVTALELPDHYWITPDPVDMPTWWSQLDSVLDAGIKLVQLRATNLAINEYRSLARQVIAQCHARNARVLLNSEPKLAVKLGADGVHLNSRRLQRFEQRPISADFLLGVSCHNRSELAQAAALNADFAVLGSVKATPSHPNVPGMGWKSFSEMADSATMPVYALGGLTVADKETAWQAGAQGIAAIRGFTQIQAN